ncbi:MAG: hypothetical protein HY791_26265 [Deltaproteobacteria bacterium]|nr:hypothetical protein [Deltaproteobacteria bacterium]
MAGIKTDTVRSGVSLLKGVLREADAQGNWNGKVSKSELQNFKESYGDGAQLDAAIDAIHKYASARYETSAPTVNQVGRALASAMRTIAKADTNKNGFISQAEIDKGADAPTWKAIIEFSRNYRDYNIDDIVAPQGE